MNKVEELRDAVNSIVTIGQYLLTADDGIVYPIAELSNVSLDSALVSEHASFSMRHLSQN